MVFHCLFWFGLGVLVHDYCHVMYEVGGYREILSPQGGWIGLITLIIAYILLCKEDLIKAKRKLRRSKPTHVKDTE